MTNTERIQANNADLRECIEVAENLPDAAGGAESVVEALSVTANGTYTAPDGVDGYSPVVVNVPIPDGYIQPSGELEVTENGTHDVTEYASVDVNVEASGGDTDVVKSILTRTITSYVDHEITTLGLNAFNGCSKLTTLDIPNVTTMSGYGVAGTALETISFLKLKQVGANEFQQNQKLISAYLPSLVACSTNTFANSRLLETVHLALSRVQGFTFNGCNSLVTVVLRTETLSLLANTNAFTDCYHFLGTVNATYNPEGLKDGYIYVPKALLSDEDETKDYRRATNWSAFASQFRAIEDYPEICEVTA